MGLILPDIPLIMRTAELKVLDCQENHFKLLGRSYSALVGVLYTAWFACIVYYMNARLTRACPSNETSTNRK